MIVIDSGYFFFFLESFELEVEIVRFGCHGLSKNNISCHTI